MYREKNSAVPVLLDSEKFSQRQMNVGKQAVKDLLKRIRHMVKLDDEAIKRKKLLRKNTW